MGKPSASTRTLFINMLFQHLVCDLDPVIPQRALAAYLAIAHIPQKRLALPLGRVAVAASTGRIHDHRVAGAQARQAIGIARRAVDEKLRFGPRLAAEEPLGRETEAARLEAKIHRRPGRILVVRQTKDLPAPDPAPLSSP